MPDVISLLEWLSSNYLSSLPFALVTYMTSFYKIGQRYRGYLIFWGEYQIYFIECDENISKFTSA